MQRCHSSCLPLLGIMFAAAISHRLLRPQPSFSKLLIVWKKKDAAIRTFASRTGSHTSSGTCSTSTAGKNNPTRGGWGNPHHHGGNGNYRIASSSRCFATTSASSEQQQQQKEELEKVVLRDLFHSFATTTNDSTIPRLELNHLQDLLLSMGESYNKNQLAELVLQLDQDGNGTIEWEEFYQGYQNQLLLLQQQQQSSKKKGIVDVGKLIQTFHMLDHDGNGVLTLDELEGLLVLNEDEGTNNSAPLHIDEARGIMKMADQSGNDSVDLTEFVQYVTKHTSQSWRLTNGFRVILVFGGPGSGKGVLCDHLATLGDIQHFSSGDILRQEVALQTPLGKTIESTLAQGKLVSSTTMIALLKKQMAKFPGSILALDGFPRSLENYQILDAVCGPPEMAIHIDVPKETMMERILQRGKDSGRSDDNEETAKERIATYEQVTLPTLDLLMNQAAKEDEKSNNKIPVYTLDGTKGPQDVWQQLLDQCPPVRNRVERKYRYSSA